MGEYDPAVTTNITSTAITDANVGLECKRCSTTQGKPSSMAMITVPEQQLQTVQQVNNNNRWTQVGNYLLLATSKGLNTVEHDVTVENGKYLIDGALKEFWKKVPTDLINPTVVMHTF